MASTEELKAALLRAARQQQFLEVVGRDEAEQRFRAHLRLAPLGEERVGLAQALGRVLAREIASGVDVPGFDRSNVDGFAVRAADTAGASDDCPRLLRLNREVLTPGVESGAAVAEGTATILATGGMVPRGADAVLMVEYTDVREENGELQIEVHRAVAPGEAIASAAGDIARGEMVLRAGQVLTSREIGVLAAAGLAEVWVWRKPRVAIFSTGDELIAPGSVGPGNAAPPGAVFDSNGAILAAAVEELGGVAVPLGIGRDDEDALTALLQKALESDLVLLSGGTSKGAGDLAARVVGRLRNPGIVVHGVALKPGKPICLAVTNGKPVVILPGFPTSAIFTFHEFVAPVIRAFAGLPAERRETVRATLPLRIGSERGRTEYVLVSLVQREDGGLAAYPISKGSGAVTTFGHADGFFAIGPQTEMLPEGTEVEVSIIGARHKVADLVIIGSHCAGLDVLIGKLIAEGLTVRALNLGSTGGLAAAKRGECDIAGIHLMDPTTGEYNRPFLTEGLELIAGYGRLQGIVFRPGDARFEGHTAEAAIAGAVGDSGCLMVNRNAGSGTRIVIDRLLKGARPAGYSRQAKTHNGVAVAVAQGVADWGVAIGTVARQYGLGFLPLQAEQYDLVVPKMRLHRAPVQRFLELLRESSLRGELQELGFHL
ncbi:MAG: molybdopterin biosynthesis protein [Candidatus Korobacteraceae bacterium]